MEEETENIPSPLSPVNVEESIPLDLEELLQSMPGTQNHINVAGNNTAPLPPESTTPSYQNLSITPTISSPALSPEHTSSPEPALSHEPAPKDLNTEDIPDQSMDLMDNTQGYYVIEPGTTPPPTAPQVDATSIQCYDQDVVLDQDVENGWKKPEINEIPDHGPFLDTPVPNLDTESRKREDFFNNFFDDRMFTVIADATNEYTHKKIRSLLED